MRKYLYQNNNIEKFICGLILSALAGVFIFDSFSEWQNSNKISYKISANPEVVSHSIKPDFGEFPLSFEANAGQTDEQVKFVSRGQGFALFLTEAEAVLSLRKNDRQTPPAVLRMRLDGANQTPGVVGQNELAGKSNYFVGDNPNNWKTDVPNYSRVQYEEVYPGIDQVFYGNGGELEYDFIVAPETDYRQIAIDFAGADALAINESGDLVLTVSGEQIVQKKPFVYQDIDGNRTEIAANYSIQDPKSEIRNPTIGFKVGEYDRSKPLVIDPVLIYSTYLGGNSSDSGRSIEIDDERNVYVTGSTTSPNFPTVNPLQPNNAGGSGDVFVTKINAAGNAIVYSTYFGGSVGDIGYGIDIDNAGNAYITGTTGGTLGANNFPTTPNAYDGTFNGTDDAFLFKLNPSGNAVVYSTFLGGNNTDLGFEVKVNKTTGEAFVSGNALSENFPTTPGAFRTACAPTPCASSSFITKFNASGSGLIYSTYIGPGPSNDLAIDADGNAYITGSTISNFFPITPGAAQPTCTGCNLSRSDAFVTKLNASGSALVYSTYLGGSIGEVGRGIAVDASGNAFVTGRTESSSSASVPFPTTPGAFQTTSPGIPDAFVTKVNPTGTAFVYSTYLGGNVRDEAFGIATDPLGNAHVIGQTRSTNFPLVSPFQSICPQNGDCVFMASLNPAGSAIIFSTFFGQGEGVEITADNMGNIYATGVTYQGLANLPTMNPIQPNHGAGNSVFDGFVAKIAVQSPIPTPTPTPTPIITPTPTPIVSGRVTYANALTTTSVPFTTITAAGSIPLSTLTDSNGDYSLNGFGSGTYTVTPSKANQVNGISNLDASTVAQQIVGLTDLNANQLIAADTSGNGTVSSLDAALIAQFVAGIPNPGITGTWKFIQPSRLYPDIQSSQTNQDYSAILVGDVTGNWNPLGALSSELAAADSEQTTQAEKAAKEEGVTVTASANESAEKKTLTLDLTAAETTGKDILGYQFELLYDAAAIEPQAISCDVSETISSEMTAMCRVSESGVLKMVVFGAMPMSGTGTLLKLNFNVIGARGSTSTMTIKNFIFNEDMPTAVTISGRW